MKVWSTCVKTCELYGAYNLYIVPTIVGYNFEVLKMVCIYSCKMSSILHIAGSLLHRLKGFMQRDAFYLASRMIVSSGVDRQEIRQGVHTMNFSSAPYTRDFLVSRLFKSVCVSFRVFLAR